MMEICIIPVCIYYSLRNYDDDDNDVAVTSLVEIIPPKVELCPSQSASGQRLVYTTSETVAIVPKPEVRFRTGDGLRILAHTCSHYGNASTNHSFALGTHRILCRARDRHATAHCQFDIHVIGMKKITFFCNNITDNQVYLPINKLDKSSKQPVHGH